MHCRPLPETLVITSRQSSYLPSPSLKAKMKFSFFGCLETCIYECSFQWLITHKNNVKEKYLWQTCTWFIHNTWISPLKCFHTIIYLSSTFERLILLTTLSTKFIIFFHFNNGDGEWRWFTGTCDESTIEVLKIATDIIVTCDESCFCHVGLLRGLPVPVHGFSCCALVLSHTW